MGKREFTIYLDPEKRLNRYRHRHVWQRGSIVEFRIQYEALIEGKWHAVVRYDSAHGNPHKDTLHPDGSETKEWFTLYGNAEVLAIGQRDIMENWPMYQGNRFYLFARQGSSDPGSWIQKLGCERGSDDPR